MRIIPMRKGNTQSGFSLVSSRSIKIREKAGFIMPIKEEINVVRTTNAIAVPVPFKRFFA